MQLIFPSACIQSDSIYFTVTLYLRRFPNPNFVLVIIITSLCHVCVLQQKQITVWTLQLSHLPHNKPDIVYVSSRNHIYLIDVAVPGDGCMASKFQERMQKYADLKFEIKKMW